MRPLEVRKYLFDIVEACQMLAEFTAGRAFEHYRGDPMPRSAVERQFEIIGEALARTLRADPGLSGRISEASRIIAFRNRLIHAYAAIANEVVWGLLEAKLPLLRREVEELLREADQEGASGRRC